MKLKDFRRAIMREGNDVEFTFNGKPSGVATQFQNHIGQFQVWHGEQIKEYDSFIEMISDRFFSGKCIVELLSLVEFDFY